MKTDALAKRELYYT